MSRVARETVSIFDLKSDADATAKKASQLASTLDLHGVKVANLEDNVKQIRTDVSDLRQDVRKLSDSASKVGAARVCVRATRPRALRANAPGMLAALSPTGTCWSRRTCASEHLWSRRMCACVPAKVRPG